jgi:nucleoside-diphosphate-sugar epimerase
MFVAGATGAIGMRLVPLLVGRGHQALARGSCPAARPGLLPPPWAAPLTRLRSVGV